MYVKLLISETFTGNMREGRGKVSKTIYQLNSTQNSMRFVSTYSRELIPTNKTKETRSRETGIDEYINHPKLN